jgi:hypothetical protein
MNERVKNLIVSALRSGDYKRCTGQLTKDGCFCFNGLILDLYRKDTGDGEWGYHEPSEAIGLIHKDNTCSGLIMQPSVINWLGCKVRGSDLLIDEDGMRYWLINDRRTMTFDIIANKVANYGLNTVAFNDR